MKYFKNTDLAKQYHVSEKSIRNWVQAAMDGKLELLLHKEAGKIYIANTSKNTMLLESLAARGKKYRNSRGFKVITPVDRFYDVYSKKEILDIISNLSIHKEIPLQYGYADGGAKSWDEYSNRLFQEGTPNILTKTVDLLNINMNYINHVIGDERKVNIVDLGPGNGLPARSIISNLLEQGRLNRYIALDVSQDMLDILENNVKEWFDGRVKYEGHLRNFNEERFNDLITESYLDQGADTPVNLVFLFGGTLSNFRLPDHSLRVINNSMGPHDMLLHSGYMDTSYTRRYFDLSGATHVKKDPQQSGFIPSLLQMDETLCDFEQLFDANARCRFKIMRPKVDLMIKINVEGESVNIELNKGDSILLWRHKHYTLAEIVKLLDENDFDVVQATRSGDQNYILSISKIKTQA